MNLKLLINTLLLALVPWPIYIDLRTQSLIWRLPQQSFNSLPAGAVPVTIGSIAFALFCLLNFMHFREISVPTRKFKLAPTLALSLGGTLIVLMILNYVYSGSTVK